jgi:hypothetical protein
MNNQFGLIPCNLSAGMFGNEYAVELVSEEGKTISFFADKGLVRTNGSQHSGYIRVSVISSNAGVSKILLPSEAIESGTRWLEVPASQLQAA